MLPAEAGRDHSKDAFADSIVRNARDMAKVYVSRVQDYKADMYVKGLVNVKRKNFFIRYLPKMFKVRKGVREYVMETYNDLHYTYPNIYDQKLKAFTGTASEFWQGDGRLQDYFLVNVYSSSILSDKVLSPLAHNGHHYYNYEIAEISGSQQGRVFKVLFKPKWSSYQLVEGYMTITEDVWSVREIEYKGSNELMDFNSHIRMGRVGEEDELLPVNYRLQVDFKIMGNHIEAEYASLMKYNEIVKNDGGLQEKQNGRNKYDLSDSYTLTVDTMATVLDTAFFMRNRPMDLTQNEKRIYQQYYSESDSINNERLKTHKSQSFWGGMGDLLLNRRTVNMNQMGNIRLYQLIDPFLLGYSHTNGISYKYRIRYTRFFSHDRLLQMTPSIGYNFKYKELFWGLRARYDYWPSKRASINVDARDGNHIYSSKMMQAVNAMPDDMFDKTQLHLDYFNDSYLKLMHSWEIINGVNLQVGLAIHHRTAEKNSRLVIPETGKAATQQEIEERLDQLPSKDADILSHISKSYNSFAPRIIFEWSPGQYYYMDGSRKVNLTSKYPRFIIDYEDAVKFLFSKGLTYRRLELDIQHDIPLGLMRALFLRAGGGVYIGRSQLYFADFENLQRHALPNEWGDEIGGVFQLLPRYNYNSSRRYVRAHATFESPFLALSRLGLLTKHLLKERIYLNLLSMPGLRPYWELGYGFGTHLFDVGFFSSFNKMDYESFGMKFTFELFHK